MQVFLDDEMNRKALDVTAAVRLFAPLGRANVRRVWLRPDFYDRLLRLFEGPLPDGFVPTVCGVTVLRGRPC